MGKLNFRIVEVSESELDYDKHYEDFREDFLNPLITVDDLMEKYGIPKYKYREWSNKIKEEEGLNRMPVFNNAVNKVGIEGLRENQNIYRLSNCYGISKSINHERIYFGKYPDIETARKVRNILHQSGWDTSLVPELMEKYGYSKEKTTYEKAIEHYDEFLKLYTANPPVKYLDILKILRINSSMYSVLVSEVKRRNPYIRKTRSNCYDGERKQKSVKVERKHKKKEMKYITSQPNGSFTVSKHINGVHRSFGTFRNVKDAMERRDNLVMNGWKYD